MNVNILEDPQALGKEAGRKTAGLIRRAIAQKGHANIILATGTSQFETLKSLIREEVQWEKVRMFHLDEYVGLPITHGASFRKYLQERFIDKISPLGAYHFIEGDAPDPVAEAKRLGALIKQFPIDVALVGVGENGHLAFNDPPADFDTEEPYLVVDLDKECREQQMHEGWFNEFGEVPQQAISMSIQQVLKSGAIICSVPDRRKAKAVQCSLEGEISNLCPASILQKHPNCFFYLDRDSASLLKESSAT